MLVCGVTRRPWTSISVRPQAFAMALWFRGDVWRPHPTWAKDRIQASVAPANWAMIMQLLLGRVACPLTVELSVPFFGFAKAFQKGLEAEMQHFARDQVPSPCAWMMKPVRANACLLCSRAICCILRALSEALSGAVLQMQILLVLHSERECSAS